MNEITSAKDAIDVAGDFIEPHYPWHRPIKATRENGDWIVEFDVGALRVETAIVRIDAETKEITEFTKVPTVE
ncbi:MAG: hypothetical protein IH956_03560 [Chloroflexi bacterium]|nr:hypothetical protein [Chloroflexota bacterium]